MTGKILIVDPDISSSRLMTVKLKSLYFDVEHVGCFQDAWSCVCNKQIDVIIVNIDENQIGMKGFCTKLKKNYSTQHICIIALTRKDQYSAPSDRSHLLKFYRWGVNDVFSRTIFDDDLVSRLRSLCRQKIFMEEHQTRFLCVYENGNQINVPINIPLINKVLITSSRVLVLESNQTIIDNMYGVFQGQNIEIIIMTERMKAFELCKEEDFDLIIINEFLNGKDGLRLCSMLKSSPKTRQIPIMFLVDSYQKSYSQALDIGVNNCTLGITSIEEMKEKCFYLLRWYKYFLKISRNFDRDISMVHRDSLTGVFNRRYIEKHLDYEISQSNPKSKPIGLLFVDIDHFKSINDNYGHDVGDDVLITVANALSDNIRASDLIARWGGDEFIILCPRCDNKRLMKIAEKLNKVVADDKRNITLSIGATLYTFEYDKELSTIKSEIFSRVDRALYKAKNQGRDGWEYV